MAEKVDPSYFTSQLRQGFIYLWGGGGGGSCNIFWGRLGGKFIGWVGGGGGELPLCPLSGLIPARRHMSS